MARTDYKTPENVLNYIKTNQIKWVDLQFMDIPGYIQHITIPAYGLDEDCFTDGIGKLDGSSIKGFKAIFESDMRMFPDPTTCAEVPWACRNNGSSHKTVRMIVDLHEAYGGPRFSRDPRYIAEKAEAAVKKAGYDVSYWGPELEFFVFDSFRMTPSSSAARDAWGGAGYEIESREAAWHNGPMSNPPIRFKEGYYPAPPQDTLQDYRSEVCDLLYDSFGIICDAHHHEVATAGQCEIDMKYDSLKKMGDNVLTYKQVVKNVAYYNKMVATFMPKPIFGDNASGMHVHQSLWRDGHNMFYDPDEEYAEMSQACRYYIGGLMEHTRSLCAITSPTTNSYKRLVPGYEAPVYVAWSKRNRSASIRVPVYEKGKEGPKRIEFRPPDTSCNIYFTFAALVCAGLDGIKKKLDPGDPTDENIYHLSASKRKELGIESCPGSLEEAIAELQSDNEFLKPAFSPDAIETWTDLKYEEFKQNSIRPTPFEFYQYFDI